jgi:hypothetical protein
VLLLLTKDSSCKVVVFSSWGELLDIVSHALGENGVEHVLARGGRKGLLRALAEFKRVLYVGDGREVGREAAGEGAAAKGIKGEDGMYTTEVLEVLDGLDAWGCKEQQQLEPQGEGQGGWRSPAPRYGSPAEKSEKQQQEEEEQEEEVDLGCKKGSEGKGAAGAAAAGAAAAAAGAAAVGVRVTGSAAAAGGDVVSGSGPRVLLLLVSQGGLGLNLTEAQHVVLLEPLLDPALEAQVLGRVARFGQQRTTHVHRWEGRRRGGEGGEVEGKGRGQERGKGKGGRRMREGRREGGGREEMMGMGRVGARRGEVIGEGGREERTEGAKAVVVVWWRGNPMVGHNCGISWVQVWCKGDHTKQMVMKVDAELCGSGGLDDTWGGGRAKAGFCTAKASYS